ncbi:MAG: ParB/RepB/Spo0J family partition protein [Hyphomicrobiales bacterium]|nr:ParB/RepB/Spo0J family partition protein [Hyphomicrobiales bacterium]
MKRTIASTDYQFKEADIPIEKLRFWPENPRIHAEMYSPYGEDTPNLTPSQLQQKIYDKLKKQNDVRKLREQIESAGLMDPLIVRRNNRSDTYDVLEGNRRLAACRMVLERAKSKRQKNLIKRFSSLSCEITPKDFPESHIFTLLGALHITGKLQWEPFAKASYVKRRVETLKKEGLTEDDALQIAANELGDKKPTIKIYVANIDLMRYANEQKTTRYSFYDVLNRNTKTRKDLRDVNLKKRWVKSIREEWGEATKFRTAVNATVKDPKALKKFQNGNLSLTKAAQQAINNGSTDAIVQKVNKFRTSIINAKPRLKKMDVTDKAFNKLKFEFRHLKTLSNEFFNILEKKSG